MGPTPIAITESDTARWVRLSIVVPSTMPSATVWANAILLLYLACRWYADLKARRRDWWMTYL